MPSEKIKENRIVAFGSFTGRNKGDLAILRSELIQLKNNAQQDVIVYLFSKEPARIYEYIGDIIANQKGKPALEVKIYNGITSYLGLKTLPVLAKTDKVIIGGGGLFFEDRLLDISFNHLLNIFILSILIRLFRKDTIVYAVGCSPLKSKLARWMMKVVLKKAKIVSVRDDLSRNAVLECLEREVELGCDPAFLLESKKTRRTEEIIQSWPKGRKILLAAHEHIFFREKLPESEKVLENFIDQVRRFAEQNDYSILTYSNYTNQGFAAKIARLCGDSANTMLDGENHLLPEELIYLISKFDFVIASQMHVGIFSYIASTAFVSLVYHDKVEQFNNYIGNENYLYLTQMADQQKVSDALSKIAVDNSIEHKQTVKEGSEKLIKTLNDFVWA